MIIFFIVLNLSAVWPQSCNLLLKGFLWWFPRCCHFLIPSCLSLSQATLSCHTVWIQVPPKHFPFNKFFLLLYSLLWALDVISGSQLSIRDTCSQSYCSSLDLLQSFSALLPKQEISNQMSLTVGTLGTSVSKAPKLNSSLLFAHILLSIFITRVSDTTTLLIIYDKIPASSLAAPFPLLPSSIQLL